MTDVSVVLVLPSCARAGASPSSVTLAISGTAISQTRKAGRNITTGDIAGLAGRSMAAGLGRRCAMLAILSYGRRFFYQKIPVFCRRFKRRFDRGLALVVGATSLNFLTTKVTS